MAIDNLAPRKAAATAVVAGFWPPYLGLPAGVPEDRPMRLSEPAVSGEDFPELMTAIADQRDRAAFRQVFEHFAPA